MDVRVVEPSDDKSQRKLRKSSESLILAQD